MKTTVNVGEALRAPFPAAAIGWKPQSVKGNRALAVPYIDARDVMDRLDEVLGCENWSDDFTPLGDGQVMCRLSIRVGEAWVTKSDVGAESEQPDKGDREKAAFSDALKRAAVKFGIGRYLYSLPAQWCDYDAQKKQFVGTPRLPEQALPSHTPRPAPPPSDDALARDLEHHRARLRLGWGDLTARLNLKYTTGYHRETRYSEIPREQIEWLIGELEKQPDVKITK